jgi:hypothetical protein
MKPSKIIQKLSFAVRSYKEKNKGKPESPAESILADLFSYNTFTIYYKGFRYKLHPAKNWTHGLSNLWAPHSGHFKLCGLSHSEAAELARKIFCDLDEVLLDTLQDVEPPRIVMDESIRPDTPDHNTCPHCGGVLPDDDGET